MVLTKATSVVVVVMALGRRVLLIPYVRRHTFLLCVRRFCHIPAINFGNKGDARGVDWIERARECVGWMRRKMRIEESIYLKMSYGMLERFLILCFAVFPAYPSSYSGAAFHEP